MLFRDSDRLRTDEGKLTSGRLLSLLEAVA